jgi:hypothetical protein
MPAPHQTIAISQLASAHAMNNADSYSSDFLVWWKDFWVSTPGMNPSPEAKAAAWAAWNAGRAREQAIWGNRSSGPVSEEPSEDVLVRMIGAWFEDERSVCDDPDFLRRMRLAYNAMSRGATQREGAADVD